MNADVEAFTSLAERILASDNYSALADADLEHVLTVAVKLYVAKAEVGGAYPPPLTAERVTPTEVVTIVSEMIRIAGLNLFDLAMWFRRAP
jgi:hypothetical protein